MARRQKGIADLKVFGLLAVVICSFIVLKYLLENQIGLVVVGTLVLLYVAKQRRRIRLREDLIARAARVIERQSNPLVRRRAQLVQRDAYGKFQKGKWVKEIDKFIEQQIVTFMSSEEQLIFRPVQARVAQMIDERTEAASRSMPVFSHFFEEMTPSDFEFFCAEQLSQAGWDARVTKQSRDQGVDVIAETQGIRVVLQCKRYSSAVGNKAVQEIVAGRAHEQAHFGVVVSNNRYTAAAEQLATTNEILLIHYSDLANLASLLHRQ